MLYQQRVNKEVERLTHQTAVALSKVLVHKLPGVMSWFARKSPNVLQQYALQRSLNYAFQKNSAAGELDFFNDKHLTIAITDIDLEFTLTYRARTLLVSATRPHVDVRFAASSYDLLLIATQKLDPDMLFFQRRLEMSGDTELGLGIKNLLASIELPQQVNVRLARALLQFADMVEQYRI